MGVDIETYRGRIGGFKGSIGCDVVTVPCKINFSSGMNAIGAVVFIGLLLIMGGIEPNPGPSQKDSKSENSGTFEIHGQEGIIKYYCRVNSETDLKTILNPWGIRNPGFILSAAGNADNVHEQFRRGHFIKETTTLIRNTGAILTTAVGGWLHELVRDIIDEVRILSDYKPVVLGIFKWESTKDTFTELPNKLMKEDRDDSHFTHFIFVENEKQCTSILWKLNSCLSEVTADDTITPTILLTHCIDTLAIECAVAAFQSNIPLTLLQTDETSQLLKTLRKKQNDKELNNSRTLDPIHLKLGLLSDTLPEESYEGYLRESIYKDQDNFHTNVIEGFKRMNAKNIDLLKLWIVLNPTATKLCFGLDTGRLKDINYKNRLFAFILKKNIVHELLYSDTVYLKLFCEKELPKMFDNPGDGSDTNSLCHVADKIRKKLGIHVAVKDGKMETDEQAIFFIFMWSLLKQKGSVSDWAYNKMTSKMTAALVGSKYLKKLVKANTNPEERESLLKMKTTYDEKAVAALEKMSKTNLSRTTKCLIRKRWCAFGDTSALLLAKDNASFLAHPAVQRKLTDIWMSPFNTTYLRNGYLKLGLCFLCPFLAHCFLQPSVHEVNSEPSQTKTKDHRNKLIKWLHSANNFICCPCTIVVYNIVATIIFLCIYAYYLIFEMEQKTTGFDIVLIIWVASLFVEELRQLITKRMNYFHDVWNIIDVLSITLFAIGEGLRLSKCCDTFGNIVMAVDFIFFTIRMFQTVSCFETFGPKLVMIGKMMQDLLYFLLLLSVMVMSYGISTQAILYPKSPVVWKTALMTFKKPFWNIFGELSLDEITGNADCTNNKSQWMNGSLPRCPTEKSTYVVPVMLGVYMLMVHVLLLNLLIAIFSKTYTKVQLKAYQHWCKLRYELILEYSERPSLCPPLIVFCHVWRMAKFLRQLCKRESIRVGKNPAFCRPLSKDDEKILDKWEERMVSEVTFSTTGTVYNDSIYIRDLFQDKGNCQVSFDV